MRTVAVTRRGLVSFDCLLRTVSHFRLPARRPRATERPGLPLRRNFAAAALFVLFLCTLLPYTRRTGPSTHDLIAMKGGGKGKKAREARSRRLKRPTYGEKVAREDRSWNGTLFGPPRRVRRNPRRHCRSTATVRGMDRHVARMRGTEEAPQVLETVNEEEADDDDTEVAVLPPDDHDAWGSHGGDEPGSGSPPGITA